MAGFNAYSDCSDVRQVANIAEETAKLDVLIVAAGFEPRAFNVLPRGRFGPEAHCVLVRFKHSPNLNQGIFEKFHSATAKKFSEPHRHVVDLQHDDPQRFEADLSKLLASLPPTVRRFGIDVSGMPSYAICIVLKSVRDLRSEEAQLVLYTAAEQYIPSMPEYEKIIKRYPDEIDRLPKSMALEMEKNLVLDSFSGYRSRSAKACLAVFAGYEAHRSTGVIEAVNPALLLLLYGKPGDARLSWRLDLSRMLHRKFERGRRTAAEVVSTLQVRDALAVLERYYNYLIDDYDLVISPVCSKMHVVASYLFWERYGETQLTFPIPIGYDPTNCPKGVGKTFGITLEPRRYLFRDERKSSDTANSLQPQGW